MKFQMHVSENRLPPLQGFLMHFPILISMNRHDWGNIVTHRLPTHLLPLGVSGKVATADLGEVGRRQRDWCCNTMEMEFCYLIKNLGPKAELEKQPACNLHCLHYLQFHSLGYYKRKFTGHPWVWTFWTIHTGFPSNFSFHPIMGESVHVKPIASFAGNSWRQTQQNQWKSGIDRSTR